MSNEPKMDKLEERVAARRAAYLAEQAKTGQPSPAVLPTAATDGGESETPIASFQQLPNSNLELKITEVRAAIAAGANPMKVARQLSEIVALGMAQKDLATELGVNKPWLSKKLGLLVAPIKGGCPSLSITTPRMWSRGSRAGQGHWNTNVCRPSQSISRPPGHW